MRSVIRTWGWAGIVLIAGCGADDGAPPEPAGPEPASVVRPRAGLDLQTVTLPDDTAMTDAVARQLRAATAELRARLDDPVTGPGGIGEAYGRLGMLLLAAAYPEAAGVSLANAQVLLPDDGRWPYYLGRVHEAAGDLDASARAYTRAADLRPADVATLVLLGNVRLAQGETAAATDAFERALALDPGAASAEFGLGRVASTDDDPTEAVRRFTTALTLNPRASAVHYPLALAYRALGDAGRAEAHLRQRGDIEPQPPDPLRRQLDELLESPNAYNIRGGRALELGDYAAAADYFRRGLDLAPDDPSLRQRLGVALAQLGDADGALAEFEQVVETTPSHAQARFSLGLLLADRGRLPDAVTHFSAAVEHDPAYLQARLELADALATIGRPEEALAHYDHALAGDPTLPDAAFRAAMALVRLGRYDAARDRLLEGADAHPDTPMFEHALARLLAAAPDPNVRDGQRAMTIVETLLETRQDIALGETAAMALAEMGLFGQAVALQQDILTAARQAGLTETAERLAANLAGYEQGRPCRTPFAEEELP